MTTSTRRISLRQRYGLAQVAKYASLGAVPPVTALSLHRRRLVALTDPGRARSDSHLTPDGLSAWSTPTSPPPSSARPMTGTTT